MGEGGVSGHFARTLDPIPLPCLTRGAPTPRHCLPRAWASCLADSSLQGPGPSMLSALELARQVASWTRDGDISLLCGQGSGEGAREPGSGCCWPSTINASKTSSHQSTAWLPWPPSRGLGLQCLGVFTQEVPPLFSWAVRPHAFEAPFTWGLPCLWAWADADLRSAAPGTHRPKVTAEPLKQARAHLRPFWESEQREWERDGWGRVWGLTPFQGGYFTGLWQKGQPLLLQPQVTWSGPARSDICLLKDCPDQCFHLGTLGLYLLPYNRFPKRDGEKEREAKCSDLQWDSRCPPGVYVQDSLAFSLEESGACCRLEQRNQSQTTLESVSWGSLSTSCPSVMPQSTQGAGFIPSYKAGKWVAGPSSLQPESSPISIHQATITLKNGLKIPPK